MVQKMINQFKPEQEAKISGYVQKYTDFGFSTEPIDRDGARSAIIEIYKLLDVNYPEVVIFLESPLACTLAYLVLKLPKTQLGDQVWKLAEDMLDEQVWELANKTVGDPVWNQANEQIGELVWELISQQIEPQIDEQVSDYIGEQVWDLVKFEVQTKVWDHIKRHIEDQLWEQIWERVSKPIKGQSRNFSLGTIHGNHVSSWLSWYKFNTEVFDLTINKGEKIAELIERCGWVFLGTKIAICSDRPQKCDRIQLNNNRLVLHSHNSPVIRYRDGFEIWCWRGSRLPERYQYCTRKWRSEWLLLEKNTELRRILIQGIGYDRIIQELECQTTDRWNEYELVKVDQEVDVEPIHLLKMICPSTESIHILRVPTYITSAREAIRWCNWGFDPTEFSVET